MYCNNSVVNAVLSSYIGKAKQEDIRIEVKVDIPMELPIDAFDICTILANALDNAAAACCGNPGGTLDFYIQRPARKQEFFCGYQKSL